MIVGTRDEHTVTVESHYEHTMIARNCNEHTVTVESHYEHTMIVGNRNEHTVTVEKGTSRQRSGKGAFRKIFPTPKIEAGKNQTNNKVLRP